MVDPARKFKKQSVGEVGYNYLMDFISDCINDLYVGVLNSDFVCSINEMLISEMAHFVWAF